MPKQIYFLTGAKGTGKSTAAARYTRPSSMEKVAVLDCEDSMSSILVANKKLNRPFGLYLRAYERLGSKEERERLLDRIAKGDLPWVGDKGGALIGFWDWVTNALAAKLTQDKYEVLVIDPVAPLEAAAAAWTAANKSAAGWTSKAYGKMEVEGVRPLLDGLLEGVHARGVNTILLTAHLKTPWIKDAEGVSRPVHDKVQPSGRLKLWTTLTTGMFWLVPAYPINVSGAPSALVMKSREALHKVKEDSWDMQRPIPPRIPEFTWEKYFEYLEKGWDPTNPKEGELPLPHEKEMMSQLLSDKQYKLMTAYAEASREIARTGEGGKMLTYPQPLEDEQRILDLSNSGMSPMSIAEEVGLGVAQVLICLKKWKE